MSSTCSSAALLVLFDTRSGLGDCKSLGSALKWLDAVRNLIANGGKLGKIGFYYTPAECQLCEHTTRWEDAVLIALCKYHSKWPD